LLSLVVAADVGVPACTLTCLISLTLLTTGFCCFGYRLVVDMPDMLLSLKNADDPRLLCPMMTAHEFGLFGGWIEADMLASGQQAERAGTEWLGHAISA